MIDDTHSPGRRSWVTSANQHADFPIQNLPLGVFTPRGASARGGIAIGDDIFDLAAALELGLFDGPTAEAARVASGGTLNPLFALGRDARLALRRRVGEMLDADSPDHVRYEELSSRLIHRADDCRLELPATIGDYTDFFAGIHHATNAGKLFRPDNPLLPNYKYVPIGYHGRASSIRPSGAEVRRPNGQRKPAAEPVPSFGPSRNLDYELELGVWIGPGNALGAPIPVADAASHIAGFCLMNDWSARDIQGWEYQPLGPFLAKNFCTSISPWVVTLEALEAFRKPLPAQDPEPLPYLRAPNDFSYDIQLEAHLQTGKLESPHAITRTNFQNLYWSISQQLAHHTVNGCNLQPGDLLASGTISGPTEDSRGCMLELTWRGANPIKLPNGDARKWLEDGDRLTISGYAQGEGYRVGFGEVTGRILPAA